MKKITKQNRDFAAASIMLVVEKICQNMCLDAFQENEVFDKIIFTKLTNFL